ncbi:MAG: prepilin-type N-terminal cleavage/methylation domain-containing protein [Candidatus Aminicenantes bacterium]|nr:prepilin-type N-terminal cleavage/methylation domain-containing protein [Candidatus Aminicenantes bacterium]
MKNSNNNKITKNNKAGAKGFTVIELLVSVSIFALIIALGVPGFKAFFKKVELTNALRTVTSAISSARYKAVEDNRSVKMCLENNKLVLKEKQDGDWESIKDFDPGEEIELSMNSAPIFYPEGYIVPLCSILVSGESADYKITISFAGRVKVVQL